MMEIIRTSVEGGVIVQPRVFSDVRGYFFESFSQRDFERQVCHTVFVQDNESKSCCVVVWCLHFQKPPFAHGFAVLSPEAVFQYKCDSYYAPDYEGAIAWDAPDLAIDWRIPGGR